MIQRPEPFASNPAGTVFFYFQLVTFKENKKRPLAFPRLSPIGLIDLKQASLIIVRWKFCRCEFKQQQILFAVRGQLPLQLEPQLFIDLQRLSGTLEGTGRPEPQGDSERFHTAT